MRAQHRLQTSYWEMVNSISLVSYAITLPPVNIRVGRLGVEELEELASDMATYLRLPILYNSMNCRRIGAWGLFYGTHIEIAPCAPSIVRYDYQQKLIPAEHVAGTIIHELVHFLLNHNKETTLPKWDQEWCADVGKYLFCLSYGIDYAEYTRDYLADIENLVDLAVKYKQVVYNIVDQLWIVASEARYKSASHSKN